MLPRVYRFAAVPSTWHQRAMAAFLWAEDGAALSHRAAAALWGLEGVGRGGVEVLVPTTRRVRHRAVKVHSTRILLRRDMRRVEGIPVTAPERTLIDLAGVVDECTLEFALEDALRRGLTTPQRVRRRLEELGGKGRAGTKQLRRLLDVRQARPAESGLEVRVERFLRARGLARCFVRQYEAWDGERRRRLDWAAPDQMVALEAHSWRHHAGRADWSRDQARNAGLEALGWRFVYVTRDDVDDSPDHLEARIRRALEPAA